MEQRLKILLPYSAGLALAGWTALALATAAQGGLPDFGVDSALFILLTIFLISGGFSGPFVGHTSLDRLAQVAAVLVFGSVTAAWIAAVAAFAWPFVDRRHNRGSFFYRLMRALHSSGMFVLIVISGGFAYEFLDGPVPLHKLDFDIVVALLVMALVMQVVNEALMAMYAQLNDGNFRKSFSTFASVLEIATVPVGVFSALIYNVGQPELLALYVFLLALLMLIVRRFAENHWALAERINEMEVINRVGRAISSSLILDDLVELLFQQCRKLINFSAFYLVLYDEEKGELDFRLHHNEDGRQPRKRKKLGEGALGWIIENNKPFLISDWDRSQHEAKFRAVIIGRTPKSVIGVPVSYGDRVLGAISVQNFQAGMFDDSDLNLLVTLADQVAVAIVNATLYEELDTYKNQLEEKVEERTREIEAQKQELVQLSESLQAANRLKEQLLTELRMKTDELDRQTKEDSLTGLYNRRFMDKRLHEEFRRAERFDHDVAVAIIDIDNFKQINDNFSHMLADEVLKIVARLLRSQCRGIDIISRYGGDEFLLCFPETSVENAAMVCKKVCAAVAAYDWPTLDPQLVVTTSIGVAGFAAGGSQQTLIAADAKLYEAKRAGRNRVCS